MRISSKEEYISEIKKKIDNNELIEVKASEMKNKISKYDLIRIFQTYGEYFLPTNCNLKFIN